MDIIFQSGDFYGESATLWDFFSSIIAEILGALIGAGAAIGIYYNQVKKDTKKREKEQEKEEGSRKEEREKEEARKVEMREKEETRRKEEREKEEARKVEMREKEETRKKEEREKEEARKAEMREKEETRRNEEREKEETRKAEILEKEEARRKEERRNKNIYLSILVQSLIRTLIKQNEYLKIFIENWEVSITEIPLLGFSNRKDLFRLEKLFDNENYCYSYLEEFGNDIAFVKKYRLMNYCVDVTTTIFDEVDNMLRNIQDFHFQRSVKYKALSEELLNEIESNQSRNGMISFHIKDIIDEYNKNKSYNSILNNFQKQLVEKVFIKMTSTKIVEEGATNFMSILNRLTLAYEEIMSQNKRHVEVFKSYHSTIARIEADMKNNSQELIDFYKADFEEIKEVNDK